MPERATPRTLRRVENALRAVLPASVDVRTIGGTDDATFEAQVAGRRLRVQWMRTGLPRELRALLEKSPRPHLVVAPRLSPGVRATLSALGIGWLDESRAAEISIDMLVISRSGLPSARAKVRSRWTAAVCSVAEALLCDARATVSAVREATGLSEGTCTNALGFLSGLGLLRSDAARGRASGRQVVEPDSLLEIYASESVVFGSLPTLSVGIPWRDPMKDLVELGSRWTHEGVDWAVTGVTAASVIAPLLTTVSSAEVYVDVESPGELETFVTKFGLRPIDGGRLTLSPFPTTSTRRLAKVVSELRIAPWPRVYADLRASGVRGEDAAEHLREVIRGE